MGTPRYPKDMATEWQKVKRDIKDGFTSGNSRVALKNLAQGTMDVFNGFILHAGAFFKSLYSNGNDSLYIGQIDRGLGPDDKIEGIYINRPNGSLAFWTFGSAVDGDAFWAFYDKAGNIVASDDAVSGQGLARPWLPYSSVRTALLTSPPDTNSTTVYAPHHTLVGYMQHPKLILDAYVHVTGTATAVVQVLDPATGGVVFTTGNLGEGFFTASGNHPNYIFGNWFRYDIQIKVSTGTGTVGITPFSTHGIQS